jgi:cell division protease FtsH
LAKDKILMGPERKSMIMSIEEKRNTAYHEAGHAIVGLYVGGVDPVHKISIIPRGQALGVTVMLPAEDRYTLTKEYAEGMIAYAMGGRAAEELIFRKQTTGAGDDINKATDIARKMVCNWGMSEKLGPLSLGKDHEEVFLGREINSARNFSEKVAEEIDSEIHRIVTSGYKRAINILRDNRNELEMLAESLLIKETLDRNQIDSLMNGHSVVTEEERKAFEEAQKKAKELRRPTSGPTKLSKEDVRDHTESPTLSAVPQGI